MRELTYNFALAYPLLLLVLAITNLVGGVRLLLRRELVNRLMGTGVFSLGLISGGYALQILSAGERGVFFWNRTQALGYGLLLAIWLPYVLIYTGRENWLSRRRIAALAVPPAVFVLFALTNRWHGLALDETLIDGFLVQSIKPMGSLFILYGLAVMSFAGVLFIQFWLHSNVFFRRQGSAFIAGSLVVAVVVVLELTRLNPVWPFSLVPLGMGISGFIALVSVRLFEVGQILPVARERLLDEMRDGLLVVDPEDRVIDVNPAARRIFGLDSQAVVQTSFKTLMQRAGCLPEPAAEWLGKNAEVTLMVDGLPATYELSCSPLEGKNRMFHGLMVLMRNVTGRERLEENLVQRSLELRRSNQLLTALGRTAGRIESLEEPAQVYEAIAEELRLLDLNFVVSAFKDETNETLVVQYASVEAPILRRAEKLLGRTLAGIEIPVAGIPREPFVQQGNTWFAREAQGVILAMFPAFSRPAFSRLLERAGITRQSSMLTVTLPAPGRVWGYGLLSVWGNRLSEDDVPALFVFTDQLASKLEKIRLRRIEQQRAAELARSNALLVALSKITARIQGLTEKSEVYQAMAEEMRRLELNFILAFFKPGRDDLVVLDYASVDSAVLTFFKQVYGADLTGFEFKLAMVPTRRIDFTRSTWFVADGREALFEILPPVPRPLLSRLLTAGGFRPGTGLASVHLPVESRPQGSGVLSLWGPGLSEADMPALIVFAGQLSGILEKNRLIEAERERREQLAHTLGLISALHRLATQLESTHEPDQILATMAAELRMLGLECFVGEFRQGDGKILARYTSIDLKDLAWIEPISGHKFEELALEPEAWPGFDEVHRGTPIFLEDPAKAARAMVPAHIPSPVVQWILSHLGVKQNIHVASLPLKVREQVTGVLTVWGKVLREEDIPALNVFANQVAVTLASARLFQETARLRAYNENIVNGVAEAILITDFAGRIRFANPAAERLLGRSAADLINASLYEYLNTPNDEEESRLTAGECHTRRAEVLVERKDGHRIPALLSRRPLPPLSDSSDPACIHVLTDISERQQAQEQLRQAEERYHALVEMSPAVTYLSSGPPDNRILYISPQIETMLGYPVADWINDPGLMWKLVDPRDRPAFDEASRCSWQDEVPFKLEYRLRHRDGHTVWVRDDTVLLRRDGRLLMQGIVTDITARREAETRLENSLREKELMLKEIHHRVKNNLQVVSSLVNLEAQQVKDPAIKSAFEDSQHRIRSMALIHERLYQSPDLAAVDFADYTHSLALYLIQNYRATAPNVSFDLRTNGPVSLGIDQAIPCGLILNEAISNALKHAFPHQRGGVITAALEQCEERMSIQVRDDGVGLPAGFDIQRVSSLGSQLILGLVRQLEGELEMRSEQGTILHFSFPRRRQ